MRLSANLLGLLKPLHSVLSPSVGEQSPQFGAHREFLDGQLVVAMACLTALPIVLLTLGAQAMLASALAVFLCVSLLGIVSVTHLKTLTLPVLVWGFAAAVAVMLFAAMHGAFVVGAAVCFCVLGFEGSVRNGKHGVMIGITLAALASLATWMLSPAAAQSAFMIAAAPWFLIALGAAFSTWTASRISQRFSTAEVQLKRERDRFHLMADHATDLITRHNGQGRTLFASAASLDMLGLAPKTLLDTGLLEKIHLQDRVQFLRAISRAANEGHQSRIKLRMRARVSSTPDWVHVEMRCRPFATIDGGRDGAVISSRDITAEVVSAQQARHAEAEAKEANAAQRRFLMTMSHELRTPLNAIIGFSDMLGLEGPAELDAEKKKEYVEIIQQSGHHLLQVVNGLLDLSRIEAGKYELTPEQFSLAEVAQTSVRMLGGQAQEARVDVRLRFADTLPLLTADRGAIQQVLINLLSNAIKFSPPESQITIDLKQHGRSLQIRVKDEGIGIPAECMDRLGEPFWQAESGSARSHQGSGLGLSVVRGLVDLHQGSLTFDSKPGVGTTVSIKLPISASKAQPVPEDADRSLVRLSQRAVSPNPSLKSPLEAGTGPAVQTSSSNQSSVTTEGQRHARVSA